MKDILEEIVAAKRIEVARQKEAVSPSQLYRQVEAMMEEREAPLKIRSMKDSLAMSDSGIIAEFKRKSPSKGWIHADAQPEDVVPFYAANGASALSILTDEPYFGGCQEFITRMRPLVDTPILRKDFIVDEYQLFQARQIGADAVLLIAADLRKDECRDLLRRAHDLRLQVLLEVHGESELDYYSDEVDMVGVNNRNLGTFHTDVQRSFDIAARLPKGTVLVSESGISSPATVKSLREVGYRGFLIGETFMKEQDPGEALSRFIKALGE